VNRNIVEQILRDYDASHCPGTDPALEAVRAAIMLEDVFGIALSDSEIDPAVLAGSSAMSALVFRLQGAG
jgi:hypothetical protein